ncbi:MAG: peptide chain release factor N(5)-glutamine methyltransferase [Pseudomonadota bacterium]
MDDYFKSWVVNLDAAAKAANTTPARLINWLLKGLSIETDVRLLDLAMLTHEQQQKIESGLMRLLSQEPISKILEEQEFYGRMFKTTHDTLDPRADSETLIETMLPYFTIDSAPHLLDLGTGTGCLLITLLLELPHATGVAVDICPKALTIAKENAMQHGVADRMQFCLSNWCANVAGTFDGIISNPPYITDDYPLDPSVALYDPKQALFAGFDGLDAYRILFDQLPILCKPSTKIIFEIGFDQAESVPGLGKEKGFRLLSKHLDKGDITRSLVFEKIEKLIESPPS